MFSSVLRRHSLELSCCARCGDLSLSWTANSKNASQTNGLILWYIEMAGEIKRLYSNNNITCIFPSTDSRTDNVRAYWYSGLSKFSPGARLIPAFGTHPYPALYVNGIFLWMKACITDISNIATDVSMKMFKNRYQFCKNENRLKSKKKIYIFLPSPNK